MAHVSHILGPTRHMCQCAFALVSHAGRRHKSHMCRFHGGIRVHAAAAYVERCRAAVYRRWEQIGFAFASRALRASLPFPGWGFTLSVSAVEHRGAEQRTFVYKAFQISKSNPRMFRHGWDLKLCATQGNVGQSRTLVESVPQNPHVERESRAVFIELV